MTIPETRFEVPADLDGKPLDGVLRAVTGAPWSAARMWIETGKVRVAGAVASSERRRVRQGEVIEISPRAPRPHIAALRAVEDEILVYVDHAVVVVNKPAGISTVPHEGEGADEDTAEGRTLDTLVREVLARRTKGHGPSRSGRAPLGVVQRLDKGTTGLIVFARTVAAKKHLAQQLRSRTMHRRYVAIAHGDVTSRTLRSLLVPNRGDGLRGSLGSKSFGDPEDRRPAVTHVERIEGLPAGSSGAACVATLIACRLETGRTHQIRIHLAEAGHALVGEHVYIREHQGPRIPAPRPMLHAAELGFVHPGDGRPMSFEAPLPDDFERLLGKLRRGT